MKNGNSKKEYGQVAIQDLVVKIERVNKLMKTIQTTMDKEEMDWLSLDSLMKLKSQFTDELVELLVKNHSDWKHQAETA